ncbi:MAG: hypothetical protein CL572_04610 [Alphaproteobacteria bacterium]|nr:hypothetical protein [Alphaproteobacteria bacterium]
MKNRILIRAFTARRDVMSSLVLKKILEKKKCEVIVSSIRQFEMAIKLWKPNLIIINVPSLVKYVKNISQGSLVALIPGEGAEQDEFSFASQWKKFNKEHRECADLIFLWGKGSYDECKKKIPDFCGSKYIVVGNPKLDSVKYQKKNNKKNNVIGMACRFPTINQHSGLPYAMISLQPNVPVTSQNLTLTSVYSFKTMMEAIKVILEKTDKNISIRPHPLEAIETYYEHVIGFFDQKFRSRISIDKSLCLAEWLNNIDIMVSSTSTSIVEAELLKKPIISLDKISKTTKLNSQESSYSPFLQGCCLIPKNFSEFLLFLNKKKKKIINKKFFSFLKEFHGWPFKQSSNYLIAHEIKKILNKNIKKKIFFLPKFLIELVDLYLFYREMKKNRLHWNCNYHHKSYPTPNYLNSMIQSIYKNQK